MILQALCKEKIGWDEPVPEEQERQWKTWLENLPKLERLRINKSTKEFWNDNRPSGAFLC